MLAASAALVASTLFAEHLSAQGTTTAAIQGTVRQADSTGIKEQSLR